MILDELIFDRTIADVNRVLQLIRKGYANMSDDEKTLWNSDLKGALNASDLNRVMEACEYVADFLLQYGYSARFKQAIPDGESWKETDMQDIEYMSNWIHNVLQALQYGQFVDIPSTTNNLDYVGQNAIEKRLHDTPQYFENKGIAGMHAGCHYAKALGGLRR